MKSKSFSMGWMVVVDWKMHVMVQCGVRNWLAATTFRLKFDILFRNGRLPIVNLGLPCLLWQNNLSNKVNTIQIEQLEPFHRNHRSIMTQMKCERFVISQTGPVALIRPIWRSFISLITICDDQRWSDWTKQRVRTLWSKAANFQLETIWLVLSL